MMGMKITPQNTKTVVDILASHGIKPDPKLGRQVCPEIGTIQSNETTYKVDVDKVLKGK
jgi:hypothetical protein